MRKAISFVSCGPGQGNGPGVEAARRAGTVGDGPAREVDFRATMMDQAGMAKERTDIMEAALGRSELALERGDTHRRRPRGGRPAQASRRGAGRGRAR